MRIIAANLLLSSTGGGKKMVSITVSINTHYSPSSCMNALHPHSVIEKHIAIPYEGIHYPREGGGVNPFLTSDYLFAPT